MDGNSTNPDGYLFICKLCGKSHEVPEGFSPRLEGRMLHSILIGDIPFACAEKPGTAQYSFSDFKPYRLSAT